MEKSSYLREAVTTESTVFFIKEEEIYGTINPENFWPRTSILRRHLFIFAIEKSITFLYYNRYRAPQWIHLNGYFMFSPLSTHYRERSKCIQLTELTSYISVEYIDWQWFRINYCPQNFFIYQHSIYSTRFKMAAVAWEIRIETW